MRFMITKIIALTLSFILGIAEEVAAQYGVITCRYQFRGQVEEGFCSRGIEGIEVKVSCGQENESLTRTNKDGRFELWIETSVSVPDSSGFLIECRDTDADLNGGVFLPQQMRIPASPDNMAQKSKSSWDREYRALTEVRFLLRRKDAVPCESNE